LGGKEAGKKKKKKEIVEPGALKGENKQEEKSSTIRRYGFGTEKESPETGKKKTTPLQLFPRQNWAKS